MNKYVLYYYNEFVVRKKFIYFRLFNINIAVAGVRNKEIDKK